MKIADRIISKDHPPYIVAEIGSAHQGSLDKAFKLIEAAKAAGADACKFQCFLPERITLDCDDDHFRIKGTLWDGWKMIDLYRKAWTPLDWFPRLFAHAKRVGIVAFSSVQAPEDVDFLEGLGCCPCYKVPSFEIQRRDLIERIAATGKPCIISTGRATDDDIYNAWHWLAGDESEANCAFLHATPYGGSLANAGMDRIAAWNMGLSDHTRDVYAAHIAVGLGAPMFEVHLTLNEDECSDPALDDDFALRPAELHRYISMVRRAWEALQPAENTARDESLKALMPSIHAATDIAAGEAFTAQNVRIVRPGGGIEPSELTRLINGHYVANQAISRGTPIIYDLVGPRKEVAA